MRAPTRSRSVRRPRPERQTATSQTQVHGTKMPELFDGQRAQSSDQTFSVGVGHHERHRGSRGLLLAMGVIYEDAVEIRQSYFEPLRICGRQDQRYLSDHARRRALKHTLAAYPDGQARTLETCWALKCVGGKLNLVRRPSNAGILAHICESDTFWLYFNSIFSYWGEEEKEEE